MSTKRTKWILLTGLILGFLCCAVGCTAYVTWSNNYNKSHPEVKSPIRILSIQIDENKREELFAELRKFSEKHHLEFHLSLYTRETANDTFLVDMRGETFHISVASKPINKTEMDFHFIVDDPTSPPSQETVDRLYDDLKTFIKEIPNVTITNEH
jgi:hypothetical protein